MNAGRFAFGGIQDDVLNTIDSIVVFVARFRQRCDGRGVTKMSIRVLALIPILCIFVGVAFANRTYPIVLGMPFLFFYMVACIVFTSIVMAIVYALDPANRREE